jgi:hypothetical protein
MYVFISAGFTIKTDNVNLFAVSEREKSAGSQFIGVLVGVIAGILITTLIVLVILFGVSFLLAMLLAAAPPAAAKWFGNHNFFNSWIVWIVVGYGGGYCNYRIGVAIAKGIVGASFNRKTLNTYTITLCVVYVLCCLIPIGRNPVMTILSTFAAIAAILKGAEEDKHYYKALESKNEALKSKT